MDITQDHIIIGLIILVVLLLLYNKSKTEHVDVNTSENALPPFSIVIYGSAILRMDLPRRNGRSVSPDIYNAMANELIATFNRYQQDAHNILNGNGVKPQDVYLTLDDLNYIITMPSSMSASDFGYKMPRIVVSSDHYDPLTVIDPILFFESSIIDRYNANMAAIISSQQNDIKLGKVRAALYMIMYVFYRKVQNALHIDLSPSGRLTVPK